jgi:hypothetical protein
MGSLEKNVFDGLTRSSWDRKWFMPITLIRGLIPCMEEALGPVIPNATFSELVKVIAILVYIKRLDVLTIMQAQGLKNKHLPVSIDDKDKEVLVSAGGEEKFTPFGSDSPDCQRFVDAQWYFLSPILRRRGSDKPLLVLAEEYPLPIIHTGNSHESGSFGNVYEVQFHHEHLVLDPMPVSHL